MSTSRFTLHDKPRELNLHTLGEKNLTVFYAFGIINPYGPTLNALAIEGDLKAGNTLPVLHLNLNPFSQEYTEVGSVSMGETWCISDLRQYFDLSFDACPTLIIPGAFLEDDDVSLIAEFLVRCDDAKSTYEKVMKFPGDPWGRVQAEMDSLADILKQMLDKDGVIDKEEKPLSPAEAEKMVRLQIIPENMKTEAQAFLFAWKGSIEHSPLGGSAMTIERFAEIWASLLITSKYPLDDLGSRPIPKSLFGRMRARFGRRDK